MFGMCTFHVAVFVFARTDVSARRVLFAAQAGSCQLLCIVALHEHCFLRQGPPLAQHA